jgi:hypothetical protein
MPEIKHQFSGGKMNKDLDERMVPNGQYRDAMNVQVSTSEGSDVGTVQNILGNKKVPFEFNNHNGTLFSFQLPDEAIVVGSISDEKIDTLYWFIWTFTYNLIISHKRNDKLNIVFYDTKNVLKFQPNNIITGINVIDDMLFWTDNESEPKKINIPRCTRGTRYPDHTRVINDQQGITWGDGVDVEEKHITVIKKTPPVTMEMKLETARDPAKIYTGVVVTTNSGVSWDYTEPTTGVTTTYPSFNFSGVTTLPGSNIITIKIKEGINSLGDVIDIGSIGSAAGLTGWHSGGGSGQAAIPVGTKFVLKPFDDDGTPPGLPVTDYVLKGVVEDAYPAPDPNTTWSDGIEARITSIDGFPPLPDATQGQNYLKYVVDFYDETAKLFEFKFPRFSYRYKYEDGEYSPYAPFTEVAFVPGSFDYHPRKGYNIGMTNRLTKVELGKFIHNDTPEDIVSVDVLFKDEASPNIYVVDTIRPDDNIPSGGVENNWDRVKNGGYYAIEKETVNSVVPANQLLRPWDNVPRKALAQDITGNRVVYGNYVQNYNLIYNGKKHLADFKYNWSEFPEPTTEVGKSIKSLREYQLGVVFIDKYGRETPVISNPTGTMKLEKDSANKNNRIQIGLKGNPPNDLAYFKFFVKETANEYYNMAMDRWYHAEDGGIWLAFPSSDRNKVDIDTFLILKKGSDQNDLVQAAARYKVLAIESEAPDFIKTTKTLVSSKSHFESSTDLFALGTTDIPLIGVDNFKLNYNHYYGSAGQNLDKIEEDLYVSFTKAGTNESSRRYRITSITNDWAETSSLLSATGSEAAYSIQVDETFQSDVNFISDDPSGVNPTKIDDGAIVNIYKYKVENKPRFDGRFFVKIYYDDVFKANIDKKFQGDLEYRVTDSRPIYTMKEDQVARHTVNAGNFLVKGEPNHDGPFHEDPGGTPSFRWSEKYGYYNNNRFASFALYFRRYKHNENNINGYTATITPATATWIGMPSQNPNYNENGLILDHLEQVGSPTTTSEEYLGEYWDSVDGGVEMGSNSLASSNYGTGLTANWRMQTSTTPAFSTYLTGNPISPSLSLNELWYNVYRDNSRDTEVWFIDNGPSVAYRTSSHGLAWNYLSGTGATSLNALGAGSGNQPGGLHETSTHWGMHLGFGGISHYQDPVEYEPINFYNVGDWNGPNPDGPSPNYADLPTKQWVEKINAPFQFRWLEDPDQTVYTIGDVSGGPGRSQYLRHSFRRSSNVGHFNPHSTDDYPSSMAERISFNHTKGWYAHSITPPLKWNPMAQGQIDPANGGIEMTLVIADNNTNTSAGGGLTDDLMIFVESIVDGLNVLKVGMALSEYTNANGVSAGLQAGTHLDSNSNQFLVVRHINKILDANGVVDYYELWLGGWDKPMKHSLEHMLVNTASAVPLLGGNYKFVQVGMNGYSPNSEFNINTLAPAEGTYGKVGAVGYTLQFLEEIEPEEILSENPAIWETEPKDTTDLDIYYEATSAIPMNFDETNIHEAFPVGSIIQSNATGIPQRTVVGYNSDEVELDDNWVGVAQSSVVVIRPDGLEFGSFIEAFGQTALLLKLTSFLYNNNFSLPWHNCYSFGNGVESDRIRDNYNLPFIANGVKASTTLEQEYKEEHRKYGLIYSGIYNSISGTNNLNQFIQAEKITKDVNPIYGSIQKLHSRDSDLVTLCEDKCLRILADKDAVFNADGNTNLTATSNVLGQTIPFSGEFGISTNPESFASESYRTYFADKVRGVILRLSKDGITPISMYGMKDWFRDNLKLSNKLIGSYDDRNDEYNITLKNSAWQLFPCQILGSSKGVGMPYEPGTTIRVSSETAQLLNIGDTIIGDGILQSTTIISKSYNPMLGPGALYTWQIIISQIPDISSLGNPFGYGAFGGLTVYWKSDSLILVVDEEAPNEVLSFREDVKGWVSFKSFTDMEFGLSMANDYYTFKEGYIYQHDQEDVDRNTFYGDFESSTVNVLLNDNPSIIKMFNTLNYEGSQAKMDQFTFINTTFLPPVPGQAPNLFSIPLQNNSSYSDQEYYNLYAKDGWSVESIITDKEIGYVNEFIEKEGKWFNNINRLVDLSLQQADTSDFTFQGIGIVSQLGAPEDIFGCMDLLASNYNPLATIDDGSCAYTGACDCSSAVATFALNSDNNIEWNVVLPSGFGMWKMEFVDGSGTVIPNTLALADGLAGGSSGPYSGIIDSTQLGVTDAMYNNNQLTGMFSWACVATSTWECVSSITVNLPLNVTGCTDPTALNYNPNANVDDGSCLFNPPPLPIYGCTNPLSPNYNQNATIDDGTCIPVISVPSFNCGVDGGCTDPGDGSGTYSTLGACVAACSAEDDSGGLIDY